MDLDLISRRAKRINEGLIAKLFEKEILTNKNEIVELVKQRWLRGKRPSGQIIGEYKFFSYQRQKVAQNPLAGGTVDLILTGALRDGLTIFPSLGGNFNIFSTDEKAILIADTYGLDVYGLTPEEERAVIDLALARVNIRLSNFVMSGTPI
ncbi:MAG: hypothetical protein ACUZ8H_01410 [Candidatus Anammoxibacter sp.]